MILLTMPGDLDAQRAAGAIPEPAREALRRRLEAWLREIRRHDPEAVPDPDRDGLFAFLEPGETAVDLPGEGWPRPLADMPFEAVQFDAQARAFFCHFVPSNSWILTVCVPDGPGLDPAIRACLVEQIEPNARPSVRPAEAVRGEIRQQVPAKESA
jgi:hypothetical protein